MITFNPKWEIVNVLQSSKLSALWISFKMDTGLTVSGIESRDISSLKSIIERETKLFSDKVTDNRRKFIPMIIQEGNHLSIKNGAAENTPTIFQIKIK